MCQVEGRETDGLLDHNRLWWIFTRNPSNVGTMQILLVNPFSLSMTQLELRSGLQ